MRVSPLPLGSRLSLSFSGPGSFQIRTYDVLPGYSITTSMTTGLGLHYVSNQTTKQEYAELLNDGIGGTAESDSGSCSL